MLEISHAVQNIYLLPTILKCPSQSSTNVRTKHTGPPHHHGPAVPELLHQHIEKKLSLLLKEVPLR